MAVKEKFADKKNKDMRYFDIDYIIFHMLVKKANDETLLKFVKKVGFVKNICYKFKRFLTKFETNRIFAFKL